ncbi:ABC transporter ATP-binding protein [Streptococcus sp. sy004]|uniref:ABC transporter ATP-binding protein n=1 Tax=Streptococcus sp. sy004 TaxID=2600149 RepID=UPI0011B7FB22|nr:ABC transporter ATP-binding protein [Streptococcus sp. sy004]TWT09868.1 ABC transporter ATP-binding protein [Streptococcus sp. sy004]
MLKLEHVTGGYINIPVLKDLSFEVNKGQLVGLIGLNGAGKSTTISEIIGLLTPYQGQISLNGLTLSTDPVNYRKQLALIPETPSLYEELTLKEHLETVILAYDLDQQKAMACAERLLKIFRLSDKLDWFPVNFSKGMKQKVMIISALMVEPSLLIVDEPFLGLDPVAIKDLTDLLMEEKEKGTAILMSTHVLDSAEKMCDEFIILHQGQVKAKGTLAELQTSFAQPTASLTDIYLSLTQEESGSL